MQEVGLSFATVLSAFNNLQGGLFYMNSKQLQVPAPAAKSAPWPLTLSTSHRGTKSAEMLPWDDPKDLLF